MPLLPNATRLGEHITSYIGREAPELRPEDEVRQGVALELSASYLGNADLEGVVADVSTQRAGWRAAFTRTSDDRSISFHLSSEISFYDISSTTPLAGGSTDPFNDVYDTRAGALIQFDESEGVSFLAGIELGVSGEDEAAVRDAASVGGVSGVRYRADEDLTLAFGLAAQSRLADDA